MKNPPSIDELLFKKRHQILYSQRSESSINRRGILSKLRSSRNIDYALSMEEVFFLNKDNEMKSCFIIRSLLLIDEILYYSLSISPSL